MKIMRTLVLPVLSPWEIIGRMVSSLRPKTVQIQNHHTIRMFLSIILDGAYRHFWPKGIAHRRMHCQRAAHRHLRFLCSAYYVLLLVSALCSVLTRLVGQRWLSDSRRDLHVDVLK